jgi:hypothetical protein
MINTNDEKNAPQPSSGSLDFDETVRQADILVFAMDAAFAAQRADALPPSQTATVALQELIDLRLQLRGMGVRAAALDFTMRTLHEALTNIAATEH